MTPDPLAKCPAPEAAPAGGARAPGGALPPAIVGEDSFRSGGMLLVVSAMGLALSTFHVFSLGAFMEPLQQEMGWSRRGIVGGLTIVSVISVVLAPFVGLLIDKVGPRRIGLAGVFIYCAALAHLAATGPSNLAWLLAWGVIALGSICLKPTVWSTAVASRFRARRGLALALALCGSGLTSMFLPTLSIHLIDAFGWRTAYAILGAGGAVVMLPLIYLFFFDARDLAKTSRAVQARDRAALPGLTIAEGFKSAAFWRLALAAFFASSAVTGMMVHYIPIVTGQGLDRAMAAAIAGAIGVASICARITTGLLLDRVDGRIVGAVAFALPLVSCGLFFVHDGSIWSAVAMALFIGFALGAELDVVAYQASCHFGIRHYGMLFGTVAGMISLGSGVGPLFVGAMFDHYGDYDLAVLAIAPVLVLAALAAFTLPKTPAFRPAGHGRKA